MPETHIDTIEEAKDENTGSSMWIWGRSCVLKILNLEQNPITDVPTVLRLLPYGCGDLVLRGVPCAQELTEAITLRDSVAAPRSSPSEEAPADAAAETDAAASLPR